MEKEVLLVQGIAAGDEQALLQLIDAYGGLIKSIVRYHLSGYNHLQEEAMQDILLAVWQNIASFDSSRSSLKNWIGAVAKYKCIDYKRRSMHEPVFSELNETMPDERFDPQLRTDIESILECLPSADRELFYRHYILGEPVAQIAKKQNKSPGFLYNRLSRQRRRLRKQLEGK